jgi:hypothetical protein
MLTAILLMMLNKNSRSQKIIALTHAQQWDYQEFVNFNDTIKNANFGLLNYSQNIILRHFISADERSYGLGFNVFDCRSIEPLAIHNCTVIMFNLLTSSQTSAISKTVTPAITALELHVSFLPINNSVLNDVNAGVEKSYFERIVKMQKLTAVKSHYAFPQHAIYCNDPTLFDVFLHEHLTNSNNIKLSEWILAHPNLHIEISNGILLAYQPNHILNSEDITTAIEHIADISKSISLVQD